MTHRREPGNSLAPSPAAERGGGQPLLIVRLHLLRYDRHKEEILHGGQSLHVLYCMAHVSLCSGWVEWALGFEVWATGHETVLLSLCVCVCV